jgi:hypothetical protein
MLITSTGARWFTQPVIRSTIRSARMWGSATRAAFGLLHEGQKHSLRDRSLTNPRRVAAQTVVLGLAEIQMRLNASNRAVCGARCGGCG